MTACRADHRCYRSDGHEGWCRDPEGDRPIPPGERSPVPAAEPRCNHWPGQPRCEVCGMDQAVPAADDRERLRERVWSAQHDLSCSEMPPHPWTDHLPWDAPEDEQDAIREADAIIEAVRAGVSPSTGDAEHALHFDPDCEECAYLARPTRETLGSPPTGDASLREAAQRVSDKASVIARGGASPRWVVDDATFSALRAALSTGDADRLHEAIRAVYYEDKHPDLSGGLTTDPADARLAAAILRRLG
jgi:hypothetical protein